MNQIYQDQPPSWSNSACMGYTILAMEALHIDSKSIYRVLNQMRIEFDEHTIYEAHKHFMNRPY